LINLRIVIENMVVVFIRKNCIRMVFVYFAFWGLQEEFSNVGQKVTGQKVTDTKSRTKSHRTKSHSLNFAF
jgi:hypothetical protein